MVEGLKCPYCGSKNIIFDYERNELVCADCGSVIEDRLIDYGFEHRFFKNRETTPRTSGNYTFRIHDNGIGGSLPDIHTVSFRQREKWRKMSRLQKKIRSNNDEKILEKSLRHLNRFIELLRPPSYVSETAGKILKKALIGKNYKEKTLREMAAAALYLAYKINGLPKSVKVYSKEVGIPHSRLWHAQRKIYESVKNLNKMIKEDDPTRYIPYLVNKLKLSRKVEYLAEYLAYLAKKEGLTNGKGALGIATASVYISSILLDEKRTQLEIAEAVNVSDVTIRNRYDEMVRSFDIEIMV